MCSGWGDASAESHLPLPGCTPKKYSCPAANPDSTDPLAFEKQLMGSYFCHSSFFIIFLFLAVLGLCFYERAFSSCGEQGPLFTAVHGPLTIAASLVAEHRLQMRRLSSCGSRAQLLRGMWDPPRPGLEPVSPALAGRLSTTAPPGKPHLPLFFTIPLCHESGNLQRIDQDVDYLLWPQNRARPSTAAPLSPERLLLQTLGWDRKSAKPDSLQFVPPKQAMPGSASITQAHSLNLQVGTVCFCKDDIKATAFFPFTLRERVSFQSMF